MRQGSASDLVDLGPSHAVMLRVVEHEPVRIQAMEEVTDAVIAGLQQDWALEQARERADELATRVEAGEALADVAAEAGLEVLEVDAAARRSAVPDPVTVANVFRLPKPAGEAPEVHRVEGLNGYGVVVLESVADGEVAEDAPLAARQARAMMGTLNASVESWALVRQLREAADIQIFEDNLGVTR